MKFSVITPLFNGMPELKKCIGSVKSQASNSITVEHIIQDGESNDSSLEFLKNYSISRNFLNPNYKFVMSSEKDKGMYDAINKGWRISRGDILSWLNHDEQYLPGTLSHVSKIFQNDNSIDVVFGNMIVIKKDGTPIAARREIPLRKIYVQNDFLYAISCTIFFRRSLFDEGILNFNSDYKCAGDLDLMLKILQMNKKIHFENKYFSLFGVDGNNLSVTGKKIMEKEMNEIQKKYGRLNSLPLRKTCKVIRMIERFINKCYLKDDLSYEFAIDEVPNYQKIEKNKIGFRFTYERANKKINND